MTKEELEKEAEEYAEENQIYVGEYCSYNHLVKAYLASAEPREKQIYIDAEQIRALQKQNGELTDELTLTNNECKDMREELKQRIRENQKLCEQIEKMKKYGKLLQDICVVLGNDNFMVAVQLESVVKKLWDVSEEKEGLKMVEDIEKRLLEIKPQEWAEITKWEIKEK